MNLEQFKSSICSSINIKEVSDNIILKDSEKANVLGGFREYIPPIYDEKQTKATTENYSNLLSTNINYINNEKAKEI